MNESHNCIVSIIVPIYNAEKYLSRTVETLRRQTLTNIEILLVNDGSTDDSLKLCREFAEIDPRIQVIDKQNGGVSSARNIGLKLAKGQYVLFVDADDYVEANYAEILLKTLQENKSDIEMCGYFREDKKSEQIITLMEKDHVFDLNKELPSIHKAFVKGNGGIYSIFNKLFSLKKIKENNLQFSEKLSHAEDFLFCIQYVNTCSSFGYINIPQYHYVNNDNSLTTTFNKRQLAYHEDWLMVLKQNIVSDVYKEHTQEIYYTTLTEVNDYCIRAKRNKVRFSYKDLTSYPSVREMIKNIRFKRVDSISCYILLIALRFKILFLYKLYILLR